MKRIKITLPEGGRRIGELGSNVGLNRGVSFELQAEKIIIEGDVTFSGNVNAPTPAPLPFDLEAAKAGAGVLWGNLPVRWIGLGNQKSGTRAHNIIEHAQGLSYAPDCDLFMVPKPKRTVWVNIYPSASQYDTEADAISMGDNRRIATVPVEIDA